LGPPHRIKISIHVLFDLPKIQLPNLLLVIRGAFKKNGLDFLISEADGSTVAVVNHYEILEVEEDVDSGDVAESELDATSGIAEDESFRWFLVINARILES
jgi:hypothetical protein